MGLADFIGHDDELHSALNNIISQYPKLRANYNLIDSRSQANRGRGQLEFYPPDEAYNPRPGNPTLEVFNPDLKGERLQSAIFGDLLHHAKNIVPGWEPLRQMFMRTITPQQNAIDQRAYAEAKNSGEHRSFEDWFTGPRLDAYIRGYLAPDQANEWANTYTPQQKQILEYMRQTLR